MINRRSLVTEYHRLRASVMCSIASLTATTLLSFASSVSASALDVLWYSYADDTSEYKSTVSTIAASASSYALGASNDWNLTFYGPGDSAPNFSGFDVLVVHSGEAFRTGPASMPSALAVPDYSGILGNRAAIEAARGTRTFISGSDADFHAVRGDTGNPGNPLPASDAAWDGALGYVVNAIDWAAAGTALNVVSFYDGEFPGSFWWLDQDSFLRDELQGSTGNGRDNSPFLSPTLAALSVNNGLTTQGLSNWSNSFHGTFSLSTPGYSPTVFDQGPVPGNALSIFRDTAVVPVPAAIWMFGSGLLALTRLSVFRRRSSRPLAYR